MLDPVIYCVCFSMLCTALMVGFNQSAYAFDEDASTGQVCITVTGDLASTVSPNVRLMLVEKTAEGVRSILLNFWMNNSLGYHCVVCEHNC